MASIITYSVLICYCTPMAEGFVSSHPMIDGTMKCFIRLGAVFGEACYWEEKYLLHSISSSDIAKRRKKEI